MILYQKYVANSKYELGNPFAKFKVKISLFIKYSENAERTSDVGALEDMTIILLLTFSY